MLSRVDDPSAAEIALRIGEPDFLDTPAYQVDTEEILVATHRQSPLQQLAPEGARALFAGQGEASLEVWVYPEGDDIQEAFERSVMEGERIAPSARIAVHPQQMSDTLLNEPGTVGILPRRWKAEETREVLLAATVPVLAITQSEAQGVVRELIACLQK